MSTLARPKRSLSDYLALVKFEHTLFALPFAYVGMALAAGGWPGWATFGWITLAMVGARTAAMALNRWIDADLDRRNPRTAGREIPAGRLGAWDAALLAILGFAALAWAGAALNPLTLALLPVAVVFLALYSFTKRFTWLCHGWLGLTIGAAGAGGWIAVTGAFAWPAVWLWAGLGFWIAGFDIVYALLDLDFDRENGVESVPARFGSARALQIARACHGIAFLSFGALLPSAGLGAGYLAAWVGVGAILVYQHVLLRTRDPGVVLKAFNANLYLSSLLLAGVVVDLLWVAAASG